jgi:hypothetical protein
MISIIKTSWLLISLPITTFIFQNYETLSFTSIFLSLYIIGIFSLKKIENYSINQKELNKTKLINYINDNIENAEDNYNIILPKLKELKSYYGSSINNNIKKDLTNDYSKREHSKMLNNIKQNYKLSNVIIKSELNKHEELITSYKNYIDKLIKLIDEEINIDVIINQL